MKRTQILATLAFAFVLGAAVPFIKLASSTNVSAAELESQHLENQTEISTPSTTDQADPAPSSSFTVSTAAAFTEAANDTSVDHITLGANLSDVAVDINRPLSAPLTINLAGNTIANGKGVGILISQGDIRVTGAGSITSTNRNALSIRGSAVNTGSNYVTVTIDAGVNLSSSSAYGAAIVPFDSPSKQYGSYGVVLNMNGNITGAYGISVNGNVSDHVNRPQINIGDSATFDNQTMSDSTPIYAAGAATWTIGRAKMTGTTGIGIRSGELTFNGTEVEIDGAMRDPAAGSNGIDGIGVVFQIEHHNAYADQIVMNINSGKYTSVNGDVFYEYGNITTARAATQVADINISGGEFTAGDGHEIFGGALGTSNDANIEIKGGTFHGVDVASSDFANFLASGLKLGADGQVIANTITPSRPSSPTSSPEAPEGPSDPEEPSDPTLEQNPSTDQNIAPDTGLNHGRGALTAASTIIPLICGAIGVIFMVVVQKTFSRRKAMNEAAVEMEIDEQIAEIVDEPEEPVVERFVAEAIERPEPKVTPVDTFILQK